MERKWTAPVKEFFRERQNYGGNDIPDEDINGKISLK